MTDLSDLTLRVTEEIKKEQKFFVQEISKATKLDIHRTCRIFLPIDPGRTTLIAIDHASEFRRIVKEHHDEVEALEHQKRGIQAQLSDFLALQSKLAPNPRQKSVSSG